MQIPTSTNTSSIGWYYIYIYIYIFITFVYIIDNTYILTKKSHEKSPVNSNNGKRYLEIEDGYKDNNVKDGSWKEWEIIKNNLIINIKFRYYPIFRLKSISCSKKTYFCTQKWF